MRKPIPIGIRATVDFIFKLLLGNPLFPEITIHFLNAVLGGKSQIVAVQLLNPTIDRKMEDDKLITFDILASDDQGRSFIIEMQTTVPAEMAQRLVYYTSRLYADQIILGQAYARLRPAITICVLSKSMFPEIDQYHLDFRLREESGQELTEDFQIHLIELEKLANFSPDQDRIDLLSPLEWWCYFPVRGEETTNFKGRP